jgi:hypothetical protein
MNWFLAFAISAAINSFAIIEFWVFWRMAVKQYEGLRNFFMRNFGYGYLLIRLPEGAIRKKFIKLDENMRVGKEQYTLISDRVYRYEGLPALFYNRGDHMPIDMEELKSDELWRNAKFMDNLFLNVKAGAEAEAEAKNSLKEILLWANLIMNLLIIGAIGYLLYLLTGGGEGLIIQAS